MMTRDVLARFGLRRISPLQETLTILAGFGTGMLVGGGLGLLFSPRKGADLRAEIGRRGTALGRRGMDLGRRAGRRIIRRKSNGRLPDDPNAISRDELYEMAKELEIEGRSEMSKEELYEAVASR